MTRQRTDALALYHNAVRDYPLLTAEEEVQLARAWREEGDKVAAEKLVLSNMRAVIKMAGQFSNQHASFSDLMQEGTLGLLRAVERYDPDRGVRFLSYASWWIRAYIRDYLLKTRSLVRLGTTQRQRTVYSRLGKAKEEVRQEGLVGEQRLARLEEIIGVDRKTISSMEGRLSGYDVSLDAPVGSDGDGVPRSNFFAGMAASPEEEVGASQEARTRNASLAMAIAQLPPREQEIIRRRHLLETPHTLQEVGDDMGVSRERVRQLEVRAMRRLRDFLRRDPATKQVA